MIESDRREVAVLLAASKFVTVWEFPGPDDSEMRDAIQGLIDTVHDWLDKPEEAARRRRAS